MRKLKIGDRVEYTGTGRNHGKIIETGVKGFCVKWDTIDTPQWWSEGNLKLLEPTPKTDQELADEYRAGIVASRAVRDELLKRGYSLYSSDQKVVPTIRPIDEMVFKKTVTEEFKV